MPAGSRCWSCSDERLTRLSRENRNAWSYSCCVFAPHLPRSRQESLNADSSRHKPTQERHACRQFTQIVSDNRDAAAIVDLFEIRQKLHPVKVAVAKGHRCHAVWVDAPRVLGMRMRHALVEDSHGVVGVVAADQEIGGIEVDAEAAGVEAVEELGHCFGFVEAGVECNGDAGAVAMVAEGVEAFAQPVPCGTRRAGVADRAGLDDDEAWAEVEGESHRQANLLQAWLQILGVVQPAAQRADDGGDAEIVRAQQVRDLTPARLRQVLRPQLPRGFQLDCRHPQFLGRRQRTSEGQPERLLRDA